MRPISRGGAQNKKTLEVLDLKDYNVIVGNFWQDFSYNKVYFKLKCIFL